MTPLSRMKALEEEYLSTSGWQKEEFSEGVHLWYKPGDPRTHGTPVPQLTAVIWQRLDDEHGTHASAHVPASSS